MGDAFIVKRGGSAGGKLYAAIYVTYPSGSVCTCTKGTKTLRTKDTSGAYLFSIPEAGTWTVSCTDGTRTKSRNVVISNQYQIEHVTLSYELILFDAATGGDNTAVTGGWDKVSYATKVLTSSAVGFTLDDGGTSTRRYVVGVRAINEISVSDYSTLKATFTSSIGNPKAKLAVCSNTDMTNIVASSEITGNTTISVTLPSSGTYCVGIIADYVEYGVYTYNVIASKVWLE